jgi:hypothetical protein
MSDNTQPNFINLSHTQVALHPNPKGIIQFIGSFIFGSFPAWSYKYLHEYLFAQGYSLILYRFPLNLLQFNHWEVALELLKEQYNLKVEIIKFLKQEHQSDNVLNIYLNPTNYLWLGHSLGCKYIILLEILSNEPKKRSQILQKCLNKDFDKLINEINSIEPARQTSEAAIHQLVPQTKSSSQVFIRNQPSVLLAPEISNTVRFIKSKWRISNPWTNPNQKQTECLIRSSKELFNLTGIISFNLDGIAEDDVDFLVEQIKQRSFQHYLYKELQGWHFEPLSIYIENLGTAIVNLFDELQHR